MRSFEDIMVKAQEGDKKTLVVAAAHDEVVIKAIVESVKLNVIKAILVGNEEKILEICKQENLELQNIEIINEKDNVECAKIAVKLVSSGRADFIMKGMLNTSDILRQVLNKEYGLRKEKVLSHVMLYSVSTYHKLLLLTDGGMILKPTLEEKVSIINNSVFLANKLDIEKPKVAVLASVENVNPAMESTFDAASLTVMCKRSQIKNCIIDGPLALDNAISTEAAKHKGITSEVAGDADILLVPNIEVGNALGKALSYFAKAENAGVIMGAKCPIVLVSRADSEKSKIYSIALGSLLC